VWSVAVCAAREFLLFSAEDGLSLSVVLRCNFTLVFSTAPPPRSVTSQRVVCGARSSLDGEPESSILIVILIRILHELVLGGNENL